MNEDENVFVEEESLIELASSEALLRELRQRLLSEEAQKILQDLPDGIHSGLRRDRAKCVFFYFTAPDKLGQGR